jgi:hypothetical protein
MTIKRKHIHEDAQNTLKPGKLGYCNINGDTGLYYNDNGDIKKLLPIPPSISEDSEIKDPQSLDLGDKWQATRIDARTFYVSLSSNAERENKISFPLGDYSALTFWKGSVSAGWVGDTNTNYRQFSLFLETNVDNAKCMLNLKADKDGILIFKFHTDNSFTAYKPGDNITGKGHLYKNQFNIPNDVNWASIEGPLPQGGYMFGDENIRFTFMTTVAESISQIVPSNIIDIWDVSITHCSIASSKIEDDEIRLLVQARRLDNGLSLNKRLLKL